MTVNSPIALFVYSRPDHVRRTVEALIKNAGASNSDLIVFSDAARSPDKQESVELVREYVAGIKGFRSLTVHHRAANFGLSKSIIQGVTQVLEDHERVIVVEDDMVTSPHFLSYMNEALDKYKDEEHVISVHGYVLPVEHILPEAFFLRGADCWGWATWRRGWAHFNPDGQYLLDELTRQNLLHAFDFNGAYGYSRMLKGQITGSNDSWAVRWYASAFLANKLTLYPGRSLVNNIGNDSSGTHSRTSAVFDAELSRTPILLDDLVVEESAAAKTAIEHYFRTTRHPLRRLLAHFMSGSMRNAFSKLLKDWTPPVLLRQLRQHLKLGWAIAFEGPFTNWESASQRTGGYDDEQILQRVLAASLKVKHEEAAFERDSVLFEEIQYSWAVTAGLMWAAASNNGHLSVLDFGGSLGSSYIQNRAFLGSLRSIRWSVVEQAHFVRVGREHFENGQLVFYPEIAECLIGEMPNVILLSAVLQYLPNPYDVLDDLVDSGADLLLIDRTTFSEAQEDLIGVQRVSKAIYPASYPFWVFSKEKFIHHLSKKFELIAETLPPEGFYSLANNRFSFHGFVMRRRKS